MLTASPRKHPKKTSKNIENKDKKNFEVTVGIGNVSYGLHFQATACPAIKTWVMPHPILNSEGTIIYVQV